MSAIANRMADTSAGAAPASTAQWHLECIGLGKSFGALAAVSDVNLRIARGEARAIIGPNGAGKSTLFHIITGVLTPTSGKVILNGTENLVGLPVHAVSSRGLARTFQLTSIFPQASVYENVLLAARAKDSRRWPFPGRADLEARRRADLALDRLRLGRIATLRASDLSHGDQRLLEVAMAVSQEPQILFLDEPTQGLSIEETDRSVEILKSLMAGSGMTVVLIEHDMEVIFQLADKIAVLHRGRLIADGTPDVVKADPGVQDAYLGGLD